MLENVLEWLKGIGVYGLLITMCLEGASVPFPGIIVVLAYGYVMDLNIVQIVLLALAMAAVYSVASLIPYLLAYKIEKVLPKRWNKGLMKAKRLFNKYGDWSIAITRPFGVGNYISYVAGLTNVKPIRYFILTFIGILPWALGMLLVGNKALQPIKDFFF